nr:methyltransferase domain-containing protein [Paenibacillus thalictri]
MQVVEHKSLMCRQNHNFDFTKHGYLNMLTRPASSAYNKLLFAARREMIVESELYMPLHKRIAATITELGLISGHPLLIADMGCGEGSHLQTILHECTYPDITGIGLDISKEAIMMAAKKYKNHIWLVGDLAKLPLMDRSVHVILNMLSPANYKEFNRILTPDGVVMKVVPRPGYLKELREALFENDGPKTYEAGHSAALFEKHFRLQDVIHVNYTANLNKEEIASLVQMTPLAWSSNKTRMESFKHQDNTRITIDLDILLGSKT